MNMEIKELHGDEIPEYWTKVLEANAEVPGIENVGVCETWGGSTLFYRPNGFRLCADIETRETAAVTYYPGEARAQERKPDLDYCMTSYRCGPVTLQMEGVLEPGRWS